MGMILLYFINNLEMSYIVLFLIFPDIRIVVLQVCKSSLSLDSS